MVSQNRRQLSLVLRLQQRFHRARRQLRKRFIGRREHRERTGALQRFNQAGRLQRRRQCLKRASGNSRVYDVFLHAIGRRSGKGGGGRQHSKGNSQ